MFPVKNFLGEFVTIFSPPKIFPSKNKVGGKKKFEQIQYNFFPNFSSTFVTLNKPRAKSKHQFPHKTWQTIKKSIQKQMICWNSPIKFRYHIHSMSSRNIRFCCHFTYLKISRYF